MAYHGIQGSRASLGIKPTREDHEHVAALSLMGIGVREICVRLGERFALGKPMSRMTLYWHFRPDLQKKTRGRRPTKKTVSARVAKNMESEMRSLIEGIAGRSKRGRPKGG
jgi:hypothetical protein